MTRYRLTFDPNPKELARRDNAGSHVVLLWSRRRHRAAVVVDDDASGALVQLDVRDEDNPLELYEHPYAYIPTRGHPGRRPRTPDAPRAAAA
jgi:hypothetical protein